MESWKPTQNMDLFKKAHITWSMDATIQEKSHSIPAEIDTTYCISCFEGDLCDLFKWMSLKYARYWHTNWLCQNE